MTLQAGGPAQLFQAVNLLTSEGQNIFSCLLQLHLHFPPEYFSESKFNLSALSQFSLCFSTIAIKGPSSNCLQAIFMQMGCKREMHPGKIIIKRRLFFVVFYRILKFIIKEQIKCLNKKKKQQHVSGRLITEFKNTHPEVVVSQAVHVKLQRLLTDRPHPFTSEAGGATHQHTLGRVQTHMFHTLLDLSHVEPLVTGARQHCKDRLRTLCQTRTLRKS